MAYSVIPDTEIEVGKPGSNSLFTKLRDNAIAIAQGLSGAPKVAAAALEVFTVGSYFIAQPIVFTARPLTPSMAKVAEFKVGRGGTISTTMTVSTSNSANSTARLYRNGSAVGTNRTWTSIATQTWSENMAVNAGDLVQLYMADSGSNNSNATFRIMSNTLIDAGAIYPPI